MALKNDTPQDDEISRLIDKMYEQLMMLRIQLMEKRKTKVDGIDAQQKKNSEISDLEESIQNLNYDYNEMLKNHTSYWKYKKATGQMQTNHSETLLAKIRDISSNMGAIVSTIPSK